MHRSWSLLSPLVAFLLSFHLFAGMATAQPVDFTDELVISGLNQPVGLTFLPDGRALILEKGGRMVITDPSAATPTTETYMTLTNINSANERGLLDITLDPNFSSNGLFYVYYSPNNPKRFRVSRFSHVENAGGTSSRGDLTSEAVIWQEKWDGDNGKNAYFACCHFGAGLDFGPDGLLYVTPGDKFDGQWAQDITESAGSIIRMNPDGSVPAGNPFADGGGPNDDYIWAYGLRNPFRARWDVTTDRFFIGEVGGNDQSKSWEDLHLARTTQAPGVNYGWPHCEGPYSNPTLAADFPTCNTSLYEGPIFGYKHAVATPQGGSLTGGIVYRNGNFPAAYEGAYFYGDYALNFIRYLTFDPGDLTNVTGDFAFVPSAGLVVAIEQGGDGALYYVQIDGNLRRVKYDVDAPVITLADATPTAGDSPLMVAFTGAATGGNGSPLIYHWFFGDGTDQIGQNVNHQYNSDGLYEAHLEVSDGATSVRSNDIEIAVGTPPTVAITAPIDESIFTAGETINFAGTASGTDPLTYRWIIQFGHNAHFHPVLDSVLTAGSFYIETSGHDYAEDTYYQITLEVTDADGLKSSDTIEIRPDKVPITFDTSPTGIPITIDGIPKSSPYNFNTLLNFEHTVSVPASRCVGGDLYVFDSWSDGGAIEHVFPITGAASYTANFVTTGDCGTVPITAGLSLQLEGDNGLTDVAGAITSWTDLSPSGNNLNVIGGDPTASMTPTGVKSAVLDGVGDKLERSSAVAGLPLGNNDRSIFAVVKYNGGSAWSGIAYGQGDYNKAFGLGTVNSGPDVGKLMVHAWGPTDFISNTTGLGVGWMVHGAVHQAGVVNQYKDGSLIGSVDRTYATANGKIVLGEEIAGLGNMNMEIAALLVYDRAVTDIERQQIEAYLQEKFVGEPQEPLASVEITSPTDGAILGPNATVAWSAQEAYPGDHVHLTLDGGPGHVTVMQLDGSYMFTNLAPGPHTIMVQVASGDHVVYANPEATASVDFTVSGDLVPFESDLALYLRSDEGVTESGGVVSSWADQSVNANNVTAVGDPIIGTPTPTGQPSISLDGIQDKLERVSAITGLPAGALNRTVFTVVKYDAASVFGGFAYGTGAQNQAYGLGITDTGNLVVQGYGAGNDIISATNGVGTGWMVQSAVLSSNNVTHYKDGLLIDNEAHQFNTIISSVVIGQEIAGAGFIDMDIAAALVFNRALSDSERMQVEDYLQDQFVRLPMASVNITSPADGATITSSDVMVNFAGSGIAAGDHVHVILDDSPTPIEVPSLSGSHTLMAVANGAHNIKVQVADISHVAYTNPESLDEIDVFVESDEVPFASDLALQLEPGPGIVQSGGVVGGWLDMSGHGNDLTASGNPLTNVTTPIGATAISFDGVDDKLERNGNLNTLPSGSANRSMFAVVKYDGGNASAGIAYGKGAANQAFGLGIRNGGAQDGRLMVQAWSSTDLISTTAGKGAGWMLQSAVVSSNQVTHYKDGVMIDSAPRTYNTVNQKIAIGSEIANLGFIDMDVAAVLVYNRAMTAGERMQVETYLRNHYLVSPVASVMLTAPADGSSFVGREVELTWDGNSAAAGDMLRVTLDAGTPIEVPLSAGSLTLTNLVNGAHAVVAQVVNGLGTPYTNGEATDSIGFTSESAPYSSSLALQFESDAGVGTSGSMVTAWQDISGKANNLSAIGDPMLGTPTPTGQPSISLDGVQDRLERNSGFTGLPAGATDRTVFSVVKYDSPAAFGGFSYGTAANNQAYGLGVASGSGLLVVQGYGLGNDIISTTAGSGAGWMVQSAVLSSNNVKHYKDGQLIDEDTHAFNTVVSRMVIGEELGGAGFIDMDIAAVIAYDRALTDMERQVVEDYLQDKFVRVPIASVVITSPAEAATITSSDLTIAFDAMGIAAGDHVHLTLDDAATHVTVPALTGSHTFNNVPDGAHNVKVQVANSSHAVYTNPEALAEVNVYVQSGEAPFKTDLALQLESNQGVVQTGGVVGGWLDRSGNGNNLTASGAPMVNVTTPTGETAISFDGVDDKLERNGSLVALPAGSANRSVFAVVKYDGGNASAGVSYGKGQTNQTFGLGIRNGGAQDGLLMVQAFNGPDLVSSTVGKGAGWMLQSAVVSANQVTHYKDGTMIDAAARTYNTVTQKIAVGSEIANLGFIDMDVAAFLVYKRALNDSERMQVESYLRDRYLVAALASVDITGPIEGSSHIGRQIDVTWDASAAATGDKIRITLDGGTPVLAALPAGSLTLSNLSSGPHSVVAEVVNAVGTPYPNTEASDTVNFTSESAPFSSNLALQLETDDGLNTAGGQVTSWTDVSGKGNNLTAAGDPTIGTPTPTGQPSVSLDGVGDKLERATAITGLPVGAADRSVFAVVKYDGGTGWGGVAYGTGVANQAFGLGITTSGPAIGNLVVQGFAGGNDLVSTTAGIGAGWMLQSAVLTSNAVSHYMNGSMIDSGAHVYNTTIGKIVVGEELSGAGFQDMDVAAILIYDRALDDIERMEVESLLMSKYLLNTVASVQITSPQQDEVVTGTDVTVEFTGLGVAPGDHIHVTLDGAPSPVEVSELIGSYEFLGLAEAQHSVVVEVVDASHTVYPNAEATAQVDFETQGQFANDPPTAYDDQALVEDGGSIGIPVLDNDVDTDGILNAASLVIVDQPTRGNLSIDYETGVVTYTHTTLGTTTDSFTYTVEDEVEFVSNLATVEVTVASGIVFRLESDLGVTKSGSTISSWADLSSSGNMLNAFGGPKETTTPNGRKAMQLDGVADKFQQTASIVGLPAGSTDRTAFSVVKYDGGSAWAGFSYGTGSPNQTFGLGVVTNGPMTGRLMVQGWGVANDLVSNSIGVGGGWLVHSAVVASNVVAHYRDGLVIGSGNRTYNTVISKVVIGEEIANIGFIDMDIAAVFVFNRALTEPERLAVEAYLKDKYINAPTGPMASTEEAQGEQATAAASFEEIPEEFSLNGNYPNPFRSATTLEFDLPEDADVRVEVYSLIGQRVLSIPDHHATAGAARTLELDGTGLASGVYVYRIMVDMPSGSKTASGKFVISK